MAGCLVSLPALRLAVPPSRRSPTQELVEFLRELTATLPDDLAETVTAALERGDDPGGLARLVRNELRQRGQIPS